jgi:hypothetical protein
LAAHNTSATKAKLTMLNAKLLAAQKVLTSGRLFKGPNP